MKARLLKMLPLFLIALLAAGGALAGLPGEADAAKKAVYHVTVMDPGTPWDRMTPAVNNESPVSTTLVINGEAQPPAISANEGTTFDLVVDGKLKKKKVKIGGQKVISTYYKVKIPKKSYKVPVSEYWSPMGQLRTTTTMKGDAKGKLYVDNADVDLNQQVKKKVKTQIGDGTVDPAGSLIIQMKSQVLIVAIDGGKKFMKVKMKSYMTTGWVSLLVKGSKTPLDGIRLPDDDKGGIMPVPLVGAPLDLEAGTGRLVGCSAVMKGKSALGRVDNITAQVWVLSIKR